MKITNLTKPSIRLIEARMKEMLKELEREFGVQATFAGGKFDALSADLKIKIKVTETPTGVSVEQAQFEQFAKEFGLSPSDYKRKFRLEGHTFEIVGFKLRAYKRPILVRSLTDGKNYVMTEQMVKNAL